MSLANLYEARAEIRRLLIAGANFAKGDFRLERLAQELKKSGEKAPVFARAASLLEKCVEPGDEAGDAADALLDAGSFISAVLSTQASVGFEGEWADDDEVSGLKLIEDAFGADFVKSMPVAPRPSSQLPSSQLPPGHLPPGHLPGYRELSPVITALTVKSAGRFQILNTAAESGLLSDYRLAPYLIDDLGDSYTEIPPLIVQALVRIGAPALPILLADFSLDDDSRKNQYRFTAIAGIAGKRGHLLYRRVFLEGKAKLRVVAVENLGNIEGTEQLIRDAANDPNKEVREAAERFTAQNPLQAVFGALFGRR